MHRLSVGHIKAYRKRDEPEFVYISDAGVATMPRRITLWLRSTT